MQRLESQHGPNRHNCLGVVLATQDSTCTIPGCERDIKVKVRGWCALHYQRWRKTGDCGPSGLINQKVKGECEADSCSRPDVASGFCLMHYKRIRASGSAEGLTTKRRFFAHIAHESASGCWIWDNLQPNGYGRFLGGMAHRWSYEYFMGDIPDGLEIDHKCRNRACVNPWHHDPVPQKINLLRGVGSPAQNARKTHCKRGHEFTNDNTHLNPKGYRVCRRCRAARKTK